MAKTTPARKTSAKAKPVARKAEPVARKAKPVARKAKPVARKAKPVARKAKPVARKANPAKRSGPPPWKHEVETTLTCSTDAACFSIRDKAFFDAPGAQMTLLNEGKMAVFATGADGTYRFKITTNVLTREERAAVAARAHMGFLTTSGQVLIDSGTELSRTFPMPIGYATCSIYAMSSAARAKNKRLPDFVVRVRWVSKDYRFTGDYDDYPNVFP